MPGYLVTTAPATEPLSVSDAKTHTRIDETAEDSLITDYIAAGRQLIENQTWRALITQTVTVKLDHFPIWDIWLPRSPAQSITSIQYVDTNGDTQTVSSSNYTLDTYSTPSAITPAYGQVWPTARCQRNSVTVVYVAGYGDAASDVPEDIVHALKLIVTEAYEDREGGDPANQMAVRRLLASYQIHHPGVLEAL